MDFDEHGQLCLVAAPSLSRGGERGAAAEVVRQWLGVIALVVGEGGARPASVAGCFCETFADALAAQ